MGQGLARDGVAKEAGLLLTSFGGVTTGHEADMLGMIDTKPTLSLESRKAEGEKEGGDGRGGGGGGGGGMAPHLISACRITSSDLCTQSQ